jgi:DNA processing protein
MEKFIHAFNLVPGIGYITLSKIFKHFGNFERAWIKASATEFLSAGLSKEVTQNILEYRGKIDVNKETENIRAKNIFLIGRSSDEFPLLLKQIDSSPFLLYRKGAYLDKKMQFVAMVGTRVPSLYGQEMAMEIGEKIVAAGGIVVSGLAFGIDAVCHYAAIKHGKPTIAVLASGVEYVTPSSHITLAENILETGGTIISEYAEENVSYKYRFLERNRIISGLCKSVIIIEAAEKSGALITARHAVSQNRDVYALVGDLTRPQAKGCLNLITQSSANPITNIDDLISQLGFITPPPVWTKEEYSIIQSLSGCALNSAQISQKSSLSIQQTNINLTRLELNNLIKKDSGSKWRLTKTET